MSQILLNWCFVIVHKKSPAVSPSFPVSSPLIPSMAVLRPSRRPQINLDFGLATGRVRDTSFPTSLFLS
jgi:hypothetical protein